MLTSLLLAQVSTAVPAAAPPQPPAAPSVVLHLAAKSPSAVLERRGPELDGRGDLADSEGFVPVCIAPCGVELPRTGRYRVGGTGLAPTWAFRVPEGAGPFTVRVQQGSAGWETAGLTLAISGLGLLLLGGTTLVAHLQARGSGGESDRMVDVVGATLAASGLTLVLVGLPLRLFSGKTSLKIEPGKAARGPRWEGAGIVW